MLVEKAFLCWKGRKKEEDNQQYGGWTQSQWQ